MELRDLINEAAELKGGQKQLAAELDLHPQWLTEAKAGRRGLPNHACMKLAEMLNIDLKRVIAASELTTAKDEKVRQYLLPFVQSGRLAHHLTIAALAPTAIVAAQVVNDFISQSSNYLL